ncbi:MAG TPA: thioredoxin family protein [Spirochaetota bacterium]|nr:thioredoxin family protein [Spirochaetota bacterium]HOM38938.1 thioredoxin family protein [Spirochaetota bacterium]HPQ49196.1 thioredoxin family protein [Spirochaetota bacterium]
MYFKIKIYYIILILSIFTININNFTYSQDNKDKKLSEENRIKNITEATEENYQFFINKKEYSIIYFYSKNIIESIKMKEIINKLDLAQLKENYFILTINIDTNSGLKNSFRVSTLPAIVILKNKREIYGITGFIDDQIFLSSLIINGIKNNDF